MNNDRCVQVEVHRWATHRGAEKLAESRDYRSLLTLANRHDWLGSFHSEMSLAELLEAMLGMVIPPRAAWLRILWAEIMRICHHLLWLGASARALADLNPENGRSLAEAGRAAMRLRERILAVVEAAAGARMHLLVCRIGGMRIDLTPAHADQLAALLDELPAHAQALAVALGSGNQTVAGVGSVSPAQVHRFGISGIVARAAGVAVDARLRSDQPGYQQLAAEGAWQVVTRLAGDAAARFEVLAHELTSSAQSALAALAHWHASSAELALPLPKVLRVPEGQGRHSYESPSGQAGWRLLSNGGTSPYRLSFATASANSAASLSEILVGLTARDMAITLLSFNLASGDLAK